MTEFEQLQCQSESFLPVDSEMPPESELKKTKKKKSQIQQGGNSFIYQQLKKIEDADPNKKRECLAKYLKQEGQMKDTSKIIEIIEQEGHAIPIMEVAIAISRYDNNLLKQLLDSKGIQQKEQKQEEIYQLNQKMKHDSILCLLSQSQQLKKLAKKQKQPGFLDFKQISPKKINQLIDMEKGKLKKPKSKLHSMIEYPKQLKDLKKQLYSLPYINRYRKQLALKKQIKKKATQSIPIVITSLADIGSQTKQFGSLSKVRGKQVSLEGTLKQVMEKRSKLIQFTMKQISLPKIAKINSQFSVPESEAKNYQNKSILETITRSNNFDQTYKNTQKSCLINPESDNYQNVEKYTNKSLDYREKQHWPSYERFSPHRKRYRNQIEKLQQKVRSLTQLSELPSQSTINMYTSLKSMQKNDLKKLEKQSFNEQKTFSNTKYRIKYKNLKEGYSRRLKQFTKERKIRQFQLQQHDLQQKSNFVMKTVKFNDKMLQKMLLPKN